jgi:hypothetical protein
MIVPHKSHLKLGKFIQGRVTTLSPEYVLLEDGNALTYDYLLLCPGSSYSAPIKGLLIMNVLTISVSLTEDTNTPGDVKKDATPSKISTEFRKEILLEYLLFLFPYCVGVGKN